MKKSIQYKLSRYLLRDIPQAEKFVSHFAQNKAWDKIFLYLTSLWLIFFFLFMPHYVELTGVLETWFPYKGLIPYKEFAAYHFPLGRWILLPLHLVSNWNLEFDPFVGLALGVGTLILIYKFGRRFLSPLGTSISLLFFSIFFWFTATGILFFHEILIGFLLAGIVSLLFAIYKEIRLSNAKIFFLGLLIALTELSGQIATITLALVGFLTILFIVKKPKRKLIKPLAIFLLGICIPLLLTSAYFFYNGALREFYFYNVPYYLLYAGYKKDSLLSLPLKELFAFYSPLFVLLLSLVVYGGRNTNREQILMTLLGITTIPFVVFGIFHPHHLNYALPILALCAGFAYDQQRALGHKQKVIFALGFVFFLYVALSSLLPWYLDRLKFPPNWRIANDLYPDSQDPMNKAVKWIRENTPSDTKIMVVGDSMFYLRSNRLPASRPSKGIPYGWNPMSQIIKEVQEKRSDYWIISRGFTRKLIDYHDRQDIVDFVNGELTTCYQLEITYDDWEIWKKTCN